MGERKMLDIKLFRDKGYAKIILESQRWRFANVDLVDEVIRLDKEWRQHLEADRKVLNRINKATSKLKREGQDASKKVGERGVQEIDCGKESEVQEIHAALQSKLIMIGNLVHDSVPISNDEANNAIIRTWGQKEARGAC